MHSVDIKNLSKSFHRQTVRKGYTTIKSALFSLGKTKEEIAANKHTVIKDLTMRIPQGASMGVIGRNGSGKSTLLKLITGIYKPESGSIDLRGRVAALIELGAGFHPDFTGRENVYLGGVMHGLSKKEITERFDDIVSFAELEAVIDDPVRTYSSGMFMRLGFSLAVHTNPDVLIVDEVLAVGDARFVTKCKDKVSELRREGKTLLLVSHDLEAVERWCDEVVWLHEGIVKDRGDPRRVIDAYRSWVEGAEEEELIEASHSIAHEYQFVDASKSEKESQRWGSREIEITQVVLHDSVSKQHEKRLFHSDDNLVIEIHYQLNQPAVVSKDDLVFGVGIHRHDGLQVFGTNTDIEKITLPDLGLRGVITFSLLPNQLTDARYTLDIACHRKDGYAFDYQKHVIEFAVRQRGVSSVGVFVPRSDWKISAV
jgi:lipopolysaccharide transport system ATP-binding protein